MEILIFVHTYKSYGGKQSISVVAPFLEMGMPDFGDAIEEIVVHLYFKSDGGPTNDLDELYNDFHKYIGNLPRSTFQRKKKILEIKYLSRLGSAESIDNYDPPNLDLFRRATEEIIGEMTIVKKKTKKTDSFDVQGFLNFMGTKLESLSSSEEDFHDLLEEIRKYSAKREEEQDDWEKLGIDWELFHSKSRDILDTPYFWDTADYFSPNGNDTGADVLHMYQKWRKRNKKKSATVFFDKLKSEWSLEEASTDGAEDSQMSFDFSTIGLAFAQIKVDGYCENEVKALALSSIRRQIDNTQRNHPDWQHHDKRIDTLRLMESKLNTVPNKS